MIKFIMILSVLFVSIDGYSCGDDHQVNNNNIKTLSAEVESNSVPAGDSKSKSAESNTHTKAVEPVRNSASQTH